MKYSKEHLEAIKDRIRQYQDVIYESGRLGKCDLHPSKCKPEQCHHTQGVCKSCALGNGEDINVDAFYFPCNDWTDCRVMAKNGSAYSAKRALAAIRKRLRENGVPRHIIYPKRRATK